MRIGLIAIAVTAAVAGTAAAATVAMKDPRNLALRKSDVPAGATFNDTPVKTTRIPGGGQAKYYALGYTFPSAKKREIVSVLVVTADGGRGARAMYSSIRKELGNASKTRVSLPAYGDEQLAFITGNVRVEEAGASILVRKNSVVWQVEIQSDPGAEDYGFSRAQALAELKKYARKQQQRVGSG